jgi:PAS domain S-box-containing protein
MVVEGERIVEANAEFLRIAGYGPEDLAGGGLHWPSMTPPEWRERSLRAEEEVIAAGACRPYEKEYLRRDGSRVPVLVSAVVLDRARRRRMCLVQDLTAARAVEAALRAAAARGVELAGTWTAGVVTEAIASSRGLEATDAVTDAQFKAVAVGPRGLRGYAARTAVAMGAIDPAAVASEAAEKSEASGELADPLAGSAAAELPVVLGPDAVAELLQALGGLAFDGRAWAEGRSALSGRLGHRVAAACVSLSDSVRVPGTLPRAFDAEGTPKAPIPLIQDGVAHRVVHDVRSAGRTGGGATSTGHATTPGRAVSGPLPRNLVLAGGGAADEAELMAPIERGLYVTRLWYVNPLRVKETLVTGVTREGTFLIQEGRIAGPAREVRFTDSVLRMLAATEALSSRARLVGTTQFYGPRFAYGVVCPALRAQGFRLTAVGPG